MSGNTTTEIALFKRSSDPTKPDFAVSLNNTTLTIKAGKGDITPKLIMTVTDKFPLQKWVYLVINVYNSGTVEAYMNGRLIKTVQAPAADIKPSAVSPLVIGNSSLTGYVTKFTRLPITLDAQTVQKNYYNGNGISNIFSTLVPYGLNLTISKGEDVQRSITVF
jgi:hypothetical protein